jgi:hypothetical protein
MRIASIFRARFITLMMEAVRTSETSACCNDTTRSYIAEGFIFILAAVIT